MAGAVSGAAAALPTPSSAGHSAELRGLSLAVAAARSHRRARAVPGAGRAVPGAGRAVPGAGGAVPGAGGAVPAPVPRHPLPSRALTPAAAPRPARLLRAETHTPKSPWVKLLGSSHQLLFPSVPKPSEELVKNKEVSVQSALSQSAAGTDHGALVVGLRASPGRRDSPAGPGAAAKGGRALL